MNLIGISNENEFYTNHYLNEIFEGDIKDQITSWQEKENESDVYKTPFKKLRGIGADYFELLKELQKKSNTTQEKLLLSREFYKSFFEIFGYSFSYTTKDLGELAAPIIARVDKSDGSPYLWIVESFCSESCDVLTTTLEKEQLKELDTYNCELNFDAIITSHIFTLSEPPRWVMLVSPYQIVLIERAKWAQKRYIRFDIEEILGRKDDSTLKAITVLLHQESLAPKDGLSLLDTLDENSHKHAFGVTEDLKYSLRSAVELLGNEALYFHTKNNPDFLQTPELEANLTRESLRYMYRLLFLFYIESRPELGFIPSKSQSFAKGYSLESLRDLELMPLLTDNDKNGTYFHESIALLFDMIYNGRVSHRANMTGKELFAISPLRSHLFDPNKTPILNGVSLRNHIWQEIIQSLSLSRPKKGKGRGRISYANLGINQLGAVYEALLSYKGFIAKEELYEVKKADSNPTELENAYFVTEAQLHEYKDTERVFDDGKIRSYKKGSFIYRLAGRDREKSASYYTPEVLTKSLVKYALKELLEIDEHGKIGKKADEILALTVCEPAMGSAAFLNEAINQLSEAYLHQKQVETNEKIAHADYVAELQKVKMHIADNNVYGVDLNPTAVELAEISLWLNALAGSFVPWFGFQLENGNSLIGARREVYEIHQLTTEKKALSWYEDSPKRLTPKSLWLTKKREVTLGQQQGSLFEDPTKLPLVTVLDEKDETKSAGRMIDSQVYHFLLGDKAMASYTDSVVKSLKSDEIASIEKWRKEFIKPHTKGEVDKLLKLSLAIDKLWQEQARHLYDMKRKTTDTLHVWGQPKADKQQSNIEYKDTVFLQEKLSADVKSSSPYVRLKIVMDYWCALWFWPIEKAEFLPTREQFLNDISLLVEKRDDIIMDFDKNLFSETIDDELKLAQITELGFIDVHEQIAKNQRLKIVQSVSSSQKFLHWELEFSDVFAKNGGFDLILGNPPWLKVEWNESGIMGEANPLFDIRSFTGPKLKELRSETFRNYSMLEDEYILEYIGSSATQNFLGAHSNYPLLEGKSNLYKCFIPTTWKISSSKGIVGLLHPEGVYDDPKGGKLRNEIYKHLKYHFQFKNELKLFSEIDGHIKFSINILSNTASMINFKTMSNLFIPQTIDFSFSDLGNGPIGGIKDDKNKWNTVGHKDRIVIINIETLKLFSKLYDDTNTLVSESKLPAIHAVELLDVLHKIASYPITLATIESEISSSDFWNETNSQNDGTIINKTNFAISSHNLILQGPHFYIGNPYYKTPRRVVTNNSHYDNLDLTCITDDYLPRSNYFPNATDYSSRIPTVDFGKGKQKITEFYRIIFRGMIYADGERTFVSTVASKNIAHVHAVKSIIFKNETTAINFLGCTHSLIYDYYVKSTGSSGLYASSLRSLPIITDDRIFIRTLCLNCVTSHYVELYENHFNDRFRSDSWTLHTEAKLDNDFFKKLSPKWNYNSALRSDYARRQALVEIDVLVAINLNITLVELKNIYRIQFPILRQYEAETFYDINGRIVFTVSKGLIGVGLPRHADKKSTPYKIVINGETVDEKPLGWEDIMEMQTGEIHRTIQDDTVPNGPIERTIIYKAPFAKCDREEDYEIAWAEFERRAKQ